MEILTDAGHDPQEVVVNIWAKWNIVFFISFKANNAGFDIIEYTRIRYMGLVKQELF